MAEAAPTTTAAPAAAPAAPAAPVTPPAAAAPAAAPPAAPAAAAPAAPAATPSKDGAGPVALVGALPPKADGEQKPVESKEAAAEAAIKAQYNALDLKIPEGTTVAPEVLGEFNAIAKEHGLDVKQAQPFLDLGAKFAAGLQEQYVTQAKDAFTATVADWAAKVKSDPEIGGAKLPATIAAANKAIAAFGGEELAQVLQQTGLASHPAMVRALARIGAQVAEDSIAGTITSPTAQASAPGPQSAADTAKSFGYGKMAEQLRQARR